MEITITPSRLGGNRQNLEDVRYDIVVDGRTLFSAQAPEVNVLVDKIVCGVIRPPGIPEPAFPEQDG